MQPHKELVPVTATHIYYIKLGERGYWEAECLRDGVLRLGYRQASDDLCTQGDWDSIQQSMVSLGLTAGVATRHTNQIRAFYETREDSIFITLIGGSLYWCRPKGPVELLDDGSRRRQTVEGWRNTSIGGNLLSTDRLSGRLLKVQMFQGTICNVRDKDYLLHKLNDQLSPELAAAEEAEGALAKAIIDLMRLLTWQDFELLVDLVFSTSGWRRVNRVGGTQKTVDLELVLPSTGERAFVQVKSQATNASLNDYVERLEQAEAYDRMFFVWHTGDIAGEPASDGVILLGPEKLSRMVLDAGLSSWLREKVS